MTREAPALSGKPVSASRVTLAQLMQPQHARDRRAMRLARRRQRRVTPLHGEPEGGEN